MSGFFAVSRGSFWRSAPAAELRGLANTSSPAATRSSFMRSKPAKVMKTSPRTSIVAGQSLPARWRGTSGMVRMFAVTSSPTLPLPRVAPTASTPSRYVSETAAPSIFNSQQ